MGCLLAGFLILTGIFMLLGGIALFVTKLYAYGVILCILAFVIFYLAYRIKIKFQKFDYTYFAREGIAISFLHIDKNSYEDFFNINYIDGPQVGKEPIFASNTIKSSTYIVSPGIHTADVKYSVPYKEINGPMTSKILSDETIKFETKSNMYYVLSYDKQNKKFIFEEKPDAKELETLLKQCKLK